MSLMQRVERAQQAQQAQQEGGEPAPPNALVPVPPPVNVASRNLREDMLRDLRISMLAEVVRAFDAILDAPPDEIGSRIEGVVDRVLSESAAAVTRDERLRLVQELLDEVRGFGPIEPFLHDETVTEVMVNGPQHIYIERAGKITRVDSYFLNDEHVLRIIDRIITPLGRRIDETSPRVDARLPDGSRVNAIIEPLSLIGPVITVRKFSARPYTVEDLVRFGTASPEMFEFLHACIEARLNVFVSGGTGSGKTTTLNVLSSFIPNGERIVTIEDAAELQLRQDHVLTLEARPANLEGEGEITIRDLLRNAMHMRPDRIIVGECRSGEALDMIQAMTTGHDGSLSTGHANSPNDMLRRLETMVLMTGYELPLRAIREQIASAVDIIVHTARLKDGSRRITNITEIYGIEEDEILTQDIFAFEQTGFEDGKIQGALKPTGVRPTFMDQFVVNGVELPPDQFGIPKVAPPSQRTTKPMKSRWGGDGANADGRPPEGDRQGRRGRRDAVHHDGRAGGPGDGHARGPGPQGADPAVPRRTSRALLETSGSSLDKIVWANWCLRDQGDFDSFNEEWIKVFPGDAPIGQGTLMPPLQRRAGFRVSLGVIAQQ